MNKWVNIFTGLLFYAYYVGLHQVRILLLDIYQQCQVPLKSFLPQQTTQVLHYSNSQVKPRFGINSLSTPPIMRTWAHEK